VLALHLKEAARRMIESLVPGKGLPAARGAPERLAEAVGILVQVLECPRLRTEVTAAERIVLIAANGVDGSVSNMNLDAAACLAQCAGSIDDAFQGRSPFSCAASTRKDGLRTATGIVQCAVRLSRAGAFFAARARAPSPLPRGLASGRVPQAGRAAVAQTQDRLCFHPPLESDARGEKNSQKEER
jgi:hypothetical protein